MSASGMGSSPIYHVLGACKGQPVAAGLLLAQEFPNCGIDKVQVIINIIMMSYVSNSRPVGHMWPAKPFCVACSA